MSGPGRADRASAALRRDAALLAAGGVVVSAVAGLVCFLHFESLWAAGACVLALAGVAGLVLDARLRRSLAVVDDLQHAADEARATGRLRRIDLRGRSGLRELGDGFNRILDVLGGASRRVLEIVDRVRGVPAQLTSAIAEIDQSAHAQEEAVEETASLLANMGASIRRINERVETLGRSSDEASSAILEMGTSVEEVARSAASLRETVEHSTSSVHEMGTSIRQVAESTENVRRIATDSAVSVTEMDRALEQVSAHVQEASTLTERVSQGADEGSQAVAATVEDIERIHALMRNARTGLEQLVGRIAEIAGIMNEIRDINDETNLLSLNAAIIAAQAGEQGKAFLVVANHVKTLARRTEASTKDIERLIASVRDDSDTAVTAMGAGIDATEKGVERSRRAGEALKQIRRSAFESSERVSEIARATEEQTRNSKVVARAVQETSSQMEQITKATSEQSRASEQMLKVAEAALDMCRHVHRSTEEQRATGRYITESISSITEMVREIRENTELHGRSSEAVSEAVLRLLENAHKTAEQIPSLNDMLGGLRESAAAIIGELTPFERTAEVLEPTDRLPA